MKKGDKVKILKGRHKGELVTLGRRDNSNKYWYVIDKNGEMLFVDEQEIAGGVVE